MLTSEEVVRKMESVKLPDIVLEDHRRELRATLLAEYATQSIPMRSPVLTWIHSSLRSWKAITVTSALWLAIALLVAYLVVIPASRPDSMALAIDKVMSDPQVRMLMAGDELGSVTVTPVDTENLEVVIEGRGGTIIIANVSILKKVVTIKEITYIAMFGSIFEPEKLITGDEADKVINIAATNSEYRQLQSKGAVVDKIAAVQTVVSNRNLITGEITEDRQEWAMVTLSYQAKTWYFLVDPEGSRVINRSREPVPQ